MKKLLASLLSIFAFAGIAAAQDDKKPDPAKPAGGAKLEAVDEVAVIKTAQGEMVIEFWPDVAPKTVESFKTLAKKGFYDGTAFHRIIETFMIQGGDPKTKDAAAEAEWGTGDPGFKLKAEFNDRKHEPGVISMARGPHPDSAGCQFFIVTGTADSPTVQYLNGKYTGFGKLIKGQDVLAKIAKLEVKPNPYDPRRELSRPVNRVGVESIKIVPRSEVK